MRLGGPEIIGLVLIVLLLFGAKRIPELMKSVGKGIKNFKEGMHEVEKEIDTEVSDSSDKTEKTDKADKA